MNTFKKFTLGVLSLFAAITSVFSADIITSTNLVANTPFTLLDGGNFHIKSLFFVNGTTNQARLQLYDSDGNATNIILQPSTNFTETLATRTNIWTNENSFLITNIESVVTHTASILALRTNEQSYMFGPAIVLASGNRTFTVSLRPLNGVTAYATQAGTLEITYELVP